MRRPIYSSIFTRTSFEHGSDANSIAPAFQDMLHDFPELIIVIEGPCDDWGSFPEARVRAFSCGSREPQCLTPDEACRRKNRRVYFRAWKHYRTFE